MKTKMSSIYVIFERCPEVLIKGHSAFLVERVGKVGQRAKFSRYIFMPSKFTYPKVVRVTAQIIKYMRIHNIDVTKFFGSGNEFKIFTAANENGAPVAGQSEALSVTKQESENGGD